MADIAKLADLLGQLAAKLVTLDSSITSWQAAQAAMDTSLDDANGVVVQINQLNAGFTIPAFTGPSDVDPAWVQSILDSVAKVSSVTAKLKSATP